MPAGRGFFYHPGGQVLLQIAMAETEEAVDAADMLKITDIQGWVREIQRCVEKKDPSKREGSE